LSLIDGTAIFVIPSHSGLAFTALFPLLFGQQ